MRPRRLAAGLAVILAIGMVIAIVLITQTPSSAPSASAAGRMGFGYATVQRRNLVATDTESGTLAYAGSHTVYNRLSGTITWLPSVGQLIKPGQVLFRIENRPVVLMDGTTPAYRDLSSSDSAGPDILELNRNLVRLGFNPYGIVEDDVWQSATTAGVDLLQGSLGETETGKLTLGQVVFLPGPQLVSTLDGAVGSTGGGGGGGGGGAATSYHPPQSSAEFVDLTKPSPGSPNSGPSTTPTTTIPTTTTSTTTTPGRPPTTRGKGGHSGPTGPSPQAIEQQIQAIVRALQAEAQAGHGGGNPSSSSSGSGKNQGNSNHSSNNHSSANHNPSTGSGGGGSATAILATSSDRLVVTVDLPASSQSEARVGAPVTVELPNSTSVPGRIRSVSPVAQSSGSGDNGNSGGSGGGGGGGGGGGSSETVPVTIALTHRISGQGLDQAAVSVEFAQARARHVLSVPVTALVATSGNSYAVQAAAAPHKLIPVTTGLFAAGYVQISGAGIYSGLEVTDSQG